MPSIVTHSVVALAAGKSLAPGGMPIRFWLLAVVCSVLPDADVVAFSFGIPYGHFFGHRGFFHSPFFGLLFGVCLVSIFFRTEQTFSKRWWLYALFFSLLSASHGILDAMTNGGLGIALLSPFDHTRYFFPWRPIVVSPIGITGFFSRWGMRVLRSEILWIWLPSGVMVSLAGVVRHLLLKPQRPVCDPLV